MTKESDDLNRAIGLTMEALESFNGGDDSLRSQCEFVLGDLFGRRFQRDNALRDLEEAIKHSERAASLSKRANQRAYKLMHLAHLLCLGFATTQSNEYLTRAMAIYEEVVEVPIVSPHIRCNV